MSLWSSVSDLKDLIFANDQTLMATFHRPNWQIGMANPVFRQVTGCQGEVAGHQAQEVLQGPVASTLIESLECASQSGEPVVQPEVFFPCRRHRPSEQSAPTPEGSYFHLIHQPIEGPGKEFWGIVSRGFEVTDYVKSNQELKERLAESECLARHQEARLQEMAKALTRIEQEECQKLANWLHDHLQQLLVAARLKVNMAQQYAPSNFNTILQEAMEILDDSIGTSRSLLNELASPPVATEGFIPVLERDIEEKRRKLGLETELSHNLTEEAQIPNSTKEFLFHVVRELLLNVIKHSGGHRAHVSIQLSPQQDRVDLCVADNGKGFPNGGHIPNPSEKCSGIGDIKHKIELLGGEFKVESSSTGSEVKIRLPLHEVC